MWTMTIKDKTEHMLAERGETIGKDTELKLCSKESKGGLLCRKTKTFELERHQNTLECQHRMSDLDCRDPGFASMSITAVIPERGYFKMRFQNLIVL